MTLKQLHSELPYIWGKFSFLFYRCACQYGGLNQREKLWKIRITARIYFVLKLWGGRCNIIYHAGCTSGSCPEGNFSHSVYVYFIHLRSCHLRLTLGRAHRLNMELDLQSLFGLLCTAVLFGWDPGTPSHPPHLGSHTRALLVSQDRRRYRRPYQFNIWTI